MPTVCDVAGLLSILMEGVAEMLLKKVYGRRS